MECPKCGSENVVMIDNMDEDYPKVEESLQYFKCKEPHCKHVFHFG